MGRKWCWILGVVSLLSTMLGIFSEGGRMISKKSERADLVG